MSGTAIKEVIPGQPIKPFEVCSLTEDHMARMRKMNIWNRACPVPIERLKCVKFAHYDFSGSLQSNGAVVVMDVLAPHLLNIFKSLYDLKFPIAKARPIDDYDGDDRRSMEDNNTSAFNQREIDGQSGVVSMHSYGLAVDINPIQNPFVVVDEDSATATIYPTAGKSYLNRTHARVGMVEPIVDLCAKHGLKEWGGHWDSPLDWHHFQTSRDVARRLAEMDASKAHACFEDYLQSTPAHHRKEKIPAGIDAYVLPEAGL